MALFNAVWRYLFGRSERNREKCVLTEISLSRLPRRSVTSVPNKILIVRRIT